MADCCLVTAVRGSERFGVNLSRMPTVMRAYEELGTREEVMVSY
jgi:hypothetical protein